MPLRSWSVGAAEEQRLFALKLSEDLHDAIFVRNAPVSIVLPDGFTPSDLLKSSNSSDAPVYLQVGEERIPVGRMAESPLVRVMRLGSSGTANVVGEIAEKWIPRQELAPAHHSAVRQASQEAERDRRSRKRKKSKIEVTKPVMIPPRQIPAKPISIKPSLPKAEEIPPKPSQTASTTADANHEEKRLQKYKSLCRLFHDKHAAYTKLDAELAERAATARKLLSSSSSVSSLDMSLASQLISKCLVGGTKPAEANATLQRLERELEVLRAAIAKVAQPDGK